MSDSAAPVAPGAASVVRKTTHDARDRIIGRYRFAVDRRLEGEVHAVAVRSTAPHGVIAGIDTSEVLEIPGVLAVVTGRDVTADESIHPYYGESRADQPVIALDRVRYVGEPVAILVADTRATAEEAAARVAVDIDPLPAVTDHDEAGLHGAPVLHDRWPDNECGRWTLRQGDAQRALSEAAFRHTATYHSPSANHAAMEPHCATAVWRPDGGLEVWSATQSVYPVRDGLAAIFGLSPARVRVRGDNLGGAFGGKLYLKLEGLAALAARKVRRPVRMELPREEEFVTSAKHAATVTITTGVDADGTIVARLVDIVWNAGAYALTTPRASRSGLIRSIGPYRIPNVLANSVARYTNTVPTGPFRGAMTGQVCWASESAIDEIAALVGIDPVEFRKRNVLRDGHTHATGEVMHDVHYEELLQAVVQGLESQQMARAPSEHKRRGRGVALLVKSTRAPSRSEATVVLNQSGEITVWCSAGEMGQGAAASMAELAASQLGVPPETVAVALADTESTPYDTTTSSSRTTFAVGLAVERACLDLCRQLQELSGRNAEGPVSAVAPADPAGILRQADLVELAGSGSYETAPEVGRLDENSQGRATDHWHQGAVAVDLEVDVETGRIDVLAAHGASYAGRVVSPERARHQTEGGMVFGLGPALMEEIRYDAGHPTATTLSDYQIPSILDVPRQMGSTIIESLDPGADPHGLGENTVPPTAPAIANAIAAATGLRIRDLPVTSEKVLRAIVAEGEKHCAGP